MRKVAKGLVLAMCMAMLMTSGASAAPDRTIEVTPGQPQTWAGAAEPGANVGYWGVPYSGGVGATGACAKSATDYCEYVLLAFTNPVPDTDSDGKLTKTARITVDPTNDVSDFDLLTYASDASGTKGTAGEASTQYLHEGTVETVSIPITTTRANPTVYILAEVVYFAASQGYSGSVTF